MATGDQQDMFGRLKALLPPWFGDSNPVLDAILWGMAQALAWAFSLYLYAKMQTRIKTASDGWLDLIAFDFFGTKISRKSGQSDSSFLNTIIINLFRERVTRKSVSQVLFDLTGRYPTIIEPQRPADTGAYGIACGYGAAGAYGSLLMPYQAFITAYRPLNQGFPFIGGYGSSVGGYGQPSQLEYASLAQAQFIQDADLIAAVEAVRPAGSIAWMRITS